LDYLGNRADTSTPRTGETAALVFNPHAWDRTDLVSTGRIYPLPPKTRDVVVRDRAGRIVPSQLVKTDKNADGPLDVAEVSFQAREVPSAGYDTYFLEFSPQATAPLKTDLRFDESQLTMENEFLRVKLDPKTGSVAGLVSKTSGDEMLDPAQGAFPRFAGRPAPGMSTRPEPPASYDSRDSKAQIDWLAKGPLFSTVRARHTWKYLNFETRVSLAAGQPYVEVVSRILAVVPPRADVVPPDIKEGYWFSLVPNFAVTKILRDFPFGVEETRNPEFHTLTFADLIGRDRGLLLLHMGTQYFQRDAAGRISNLAMREWESYFSHEYGWPIYAEYRHALLPHSGTMDNAARIRAAEAFARPLICAQKKPKTGEGPSTQCFFGVSGQGVRFSAFKKKSAGGYELRVVETEGRPARADVAIQLPLKRAVSTDLLGNRIADASFGEGKLKIAAEPWKILTFHLE
jgi:alpha-mannosidase